MAVKNREFPHATDRLGELVKLVHAAQRAHAIETLPETWHEPGLPATMRWEYGWQDGDGADPEQIIWHTSDVLDAYSAHINYGRVVWRQLLTSPVRIA